MHIYKGLDAYSTYYYDQRLYVHPYNFLNLIYIEGGYRFFFLYLRCLRLKDPLHKINRLMVYMSEGDLRYFLKSQYIVTYFINIYRKPFIWKN